MSKYLRMKNGDEHKVLSMDGKYYHCECGTIRILNEDIVEVFEKEQKKKKKEEPKEVVEELVEEVSEKKKDKE